MTVFLFPGQGSEAPGMGGAAVTRPGPVKALLDRASSAVGQDLSAVVVRGGPPLARTELGQPALIAVSLGLALDSRLVPTAAAGHSVGEIAAFAIAGCLSPEEAIDAVVLRARLMAQAPKGAMAALRASSEAEARAAIAGTSIEIAAHNGPEEWVLSGDRAELAALAGRAPIGMLPVSGAWHSRAIAAAVGPWREALGRVQWRRPRVPLAANATGRFVEDEDLADLLAGQLVKPVRWAETMATLGAQRFDVFGPGRVLRGLCRANHGAAAQVALHEGDDAAPEARA